MSTPRADRRNNGSWFGSFDGPCGSVPLPLCQLVGFPAGQGSTPAVCYNRNTELFGQIVLMPSTVGVYLASFIMFVNIIWHVKSKYTAIGRKEMVIFFYLCMLTFFVEFLLTTGAIGAASAAYTHVTAAHVGLISATFLCLLLNGLISFQIIEDGTAKSVWLVRLSSASAFAVSYLVALDTFSGVVRVFDRANPAALWIVYFAINGGFLAIYVVLQVLLVLRMLDSRWPLGDFLIAVTFFVLSCLLLFAFGTEICEHTNHYVDGLFFGTLFNLLAILMVYKYWDSITREDLEFAVASGGKSWEAREDAVPAGEMRPGDALYFDGPASPALSLVVGARTAASSLYAPDLPFALPATSSVYAPDLPFALPAAEPRGIAVPARYRGPDPFPAPFWGSDWRQSAAIFGPASPGGGGGAPPVVAVGLRPARRSVSADSLAPPPYHGPRYARNPSLQIPAAYALLFSAHPGGRRRADDRPEPDGFEPYPAARPLPPPRPRPPPSLSNRAKELPPWPRREDPPPNFPPPTF